MLRKKDGEKSKSALVSFPAHLVGCQDILILYYTCQTEYSSKILPINYYIIFHGDRLLVTLSNSQRRQESFTLHIVRN